MAIRSRDKATESLFPFKVPKNKKGRAYTWKYYELRPADGAPCVECRMPIKGKGLFFAQDMLVGPACRPECLHKNLGLDKNTRLKAGK